MAAPDFSLLTKKRFGPIFVVQFMGAFNDNLLKFALIFLANYGIFRAEPDKAELLATVSPGIFILPYFLFSSVAGQLADGMDKARLVRIVKAVEIGIMALALFGFWVESVPLLLATLFLMGLHSTIFGPVKFSILPQHLDRHEIMGGTGLIEAGTFVAILSGQLLAGVITPLQAGFVAIGIAGAGFLASFGVPAAPPAGARHPIDWNILRGTWNILRTASEGRGVWLSILGISWFFASGAVLVTYFVPLVGVTLSGDQGVATLFLLVFSISVAIGSLLVNRLLKGEVSARYVPMSALFLALFMIDLWFSTSHFAIASPQSDISQFLDTPGSWRILVDLAGLAISGGMFIVPLYAIVQTNSPPEARSRIIAANNIVNAGVTVLVVIAAAGLLAAGVDIPGVIGALGFATLAVALISCALLPETVIKWLVRGFLTLLYRIEVDGEEHMPKEGAPAVVVLNHVSWLDGLIAAAFLPGKPTFAIHTAVAAKWWVKPALKLFEAFPVDPTNPMATKAMVKAVKEGRTLVIFPEGRITVTGALMKVFDGPGMVADKAHAPIVPVRIDGAQYTPFSRLKGKVRRRLFPKITLSILPQRHVEIDEEIKGRARRTIAARQLYDVMSAMIFKSSDIDRTLFEALLDAQHIHGGGTAVIEDMKREPMAYKKLIIGCKALGAPLAKRTQQGEAVGLLLPNVNGVVAAFFALQAYGRVPAMLNFTAGLSAMQSACKAAEIGTIITAHAFVEQGKLEDVMQGLEDEGHIILYLEDIAETIGLGAKLAALFKAKFALRRHRRLGISPDAPAVILFTSGSEGAPKGVVLTHRNLLANCHQLSARVDFNASDVVLNALPVFHSFGLTGGMLLPVLNGIKTVLYPSPLHYRIVPALAYDANATIMFGTDTFLAGYARMANSYDFYSLRYIFAGAEKVREETRTAYMNKFGLRIMEGYGATEAGPVIAVNTPMHFQAGSVGRLLPAIEARLDDVPGIDEGGRLFIRGPNVMAGYLKADKPGVLQPPEDGWHDTGDIVTIDDEGFVVIRGRAKRFAKIAGEMVSLPAVEGYAGKVWPDADHAIVTKPDAKKGEALVMFTTAKDADSKKLQAWGKENGVTELMIPRDIRHVDELPVLGTGKLDYVTMGEMAAE